MSYRSAPTRDQSQAIDRSAPPGESTVVFAHEIPPLTESRNVVAEKRTWSEPPASGRTVSRGRNRTPVPCRPRSLERQDERAHTNWQSLYSAASFTALWTGRLTILAILLPVHVLAWVAYALTDEVDPDPTPCGCREFALGGCRSHNAAGHDRAEPPTVGTL